MSKSITSIYCVAANEAEAKSIGHTLIRERLAACVNIFPGITSIYEWEGKICEETEAVFTCKTESDRISEVMDRIKSLHSYKVPCIMEFAPSFCQKDFANWIHGQVKR
jgi:periplasmic divalent cation tolerance protein